MPSRLLVLGLFGWVAGIVPAIVDGTIRNNIVVHNTQWVPGHFHFYLLIGVLPMVLAVIYHVIGSRAARAPAPPNSGADRLSFPLNLVGGLIFTLAFLDAGRLSVARRMAEHWDAWIFTDQMGSIGALLVVLAMLYFTVRVSLGLLGGGSTADAAR